MLPRITVEENRARTFLWVFFQSDKYTVHARTLARSGRETSSSIVSHLRFCLIFLEDASPCLLIVEVIVTWLHISLMYSFLISANPSIHLTYRTVSMSIHSYSPEHEIINGRSRAEHMQLLTAAHGDGAH